MGRSQARATDIDLVVLWVDGSDANWINDKKKYVHDVSDGDSTNIRYRDWGLLKYWFRAVEKNIPWYNQVYLVTCGHYPEWLNLECPKLKLVTHSEFMPIEHLPTFNSNAIEVNLHRVEGLSERFILFNDDMYIVRPMKMEDFFVDGMPCDEALMDALCPSGRVYNTLTNNMAIINNHFSKTGIVRLSNRKWFNIRYGIDLYRNFALYPWKRFSGIYNQHLPIAYNKKTFDVVWQTEPERLYLTSGNRVRNNMDVSHWLFRYWRLAEGAFVPKKISGSFYTVDGNEETTQAVISSIVSPRRDMICINDAEDIADYEGIRDRLEAAFRERYHEKSVFEK